MKLPNHQQHLPGEILNYMASCWKTCPQVQSAASVHHVLAQMKILIIHSGTQTPSGVGGDLLSEKNCSSSRAHQDSICVGGSKVFTIGSGHSHCNISRFATHWWHANAPLAGINWFLDGGTLYWQTTNSFILRRKTYSTSHNHGTGWVSRIISLIWNHHFKAWIDRSQALHGHNQQFENLSWRHRAQFRIRFLFDRRNLFSRFICNWWPYHLSRVPDPTHLKNWLALNEARIIEQETPAPVNNTSFNISPPLCATMWSSLSLFMHYVKSCSHWAVLWVLLFVMARSLVSQLTFWQRDQWKRVGVAQNGIEEIGGETYLYPALFWCRSSIQGPDGSNTVKMTSPSVGSNSSTVVIARQNTPSVALHMLVDFDLCFAICSAKEQALRHLPLQGSSLRIVKRVQYEDLDERQWVWKRPRLSTAFHLLPTFPSTQLHVNAWRKRSS
jgi:hypothetical protein